MSQFGSSGCWRLSRSFSCCTSATTSITVHALLSLGCHQGHLLCHGHLSNRFWGRSGRFGGRFWCDRRSPWSCCPSHTVSLCRGRSGPSGFDLVQQGIATGPTRATTTSEERMRRSGWSCRRVHGCDRWVVFPFVGDGDFFFFVVRLLVVGELVRHLRTRMVYSS